MVTDQDAPEPPNRFMGSSDLAALICGGGLVVATPATPDGNCSVAVQSTVQLDGDVITTIARTIVAEKAVLRSHLTEVEQRIHAVARIIKRTVWILRVVIGMALVGWPYMVYDNPTFSDFLPPSVVWIGSVAVSVAILGCVMRASRIRDFLLSWVFKGLSRFAIR